MKAELEDSLGTLPSTQEPRAVTIEDGPLYSLQSIHLLICEISVAVFQLSTQRKDYKVFTTSLYEIDCLLDDTNSQETNPNPLEEQRLVWASKAEELARITQDLAHTENKNHHLPEEDEFACLPELY
jgi:hypothetical protein